MVKPSFLKMTVYTVCTTVGILIGFLCLGSIFVVGVCVHERSEWKFKRLVREITCRSSGVGFGRVLF